MTEYDYSPDAMERYLEKQNTVARWIDGQAKEAHKYSNPLVPDNYTSSASPSRSNSGGSGGRGAPLPRSVSTPPDPRYQHAQVYAPAYGYPHGQGYGHRSGHSNHRSSHTSSNSASTATLVQPQPHRYHSGLGSSSHSRSHSSSQTAVYSSNGASKRPPPARSHTYATAMASMSATHLPQHSGRAPTRSQTLPPQAQPQFTSAPGQTVVMQHGRQTYVVVPANGARVQVCSPQSTSPTYATPQNYVPAHYPYAPRESGNPKKAPLLKRIFGLPNSHNNGNAGHADYYDPRRSGNNVPVMTTAGARRRTTSMHH